MTDELAKQLAEDVRMQVAAVAAARQATATVAAAIPAGDGPQEMVMPQRIATMLAAARILRDSAVTCLRISGCDVDEIYSMVEIGTDIAERATTRSNAQATADRAAGNKGEPS